MKDSRVGKSGAAGSSQPMAKLSKHAGGTACPARSCHRRSQLHVVGRMPAIAEQRAFEALELIGCEGVVASTGKLAGHDRPVKAAAAPAAAPAAALPVPLLPSAADSSTCQSALTNNYECINKFRLISP